MTSKTFRRSAAAAAVLVTGALALAACGGSSSKASDASNTSAATTPATTTTSGSATNSFAAYATCLRQNGVTLPNFGNRRPGGNGGAPPTNGTPPAGANRPGANGGGFFRQGLSAAQRAKFQTAQTACAKLRPAGRGGFGFGRGGGGNFNSPAFAAYRNCLTLHGVKFTRPQGGGGGRPPATTAKMRAALTACAALRPAGFGRRPPATGSGSTSG